MCVYVYVYGSNINSISLEKSIKMKVTPIINLGKKLVRVTMQFKYLEQSRTNGVVPKGIASQMKFTPSIHDNELMEGCKCIMHSAASRMLDYMIS